MIGDKKLVSLLEKQFSEYLTFIDKCELSPNAKIELYTKLQSTLSDKVIKTSFEHGRRTESRKRDNVTVKENSNENTNVFTEEEELKISQFVKYFIENGADAPINFMFELTPEDKRLLVEAGNRVKTSSKSL